MDIFHILWTVLLPGFCSWLGHFLGSEVCQLRAFSKAHRSRLAILCGAVASVLSLTTLFFSHRLGGELNTVQFQGLISLELTVVLPMLVFFGHKIGRYFRSIDPGSKDRH